MKTEEKERKLTVSDRCDQCAAQAWVMVKGKNGELYFCSHHFNTNEKSLQDWAKEIFDERKFLL
jgi:hypothetical protein